MLSIWAKRRERLYRDFPHPASSQIAFLISMPLALHRGSPIVIAGVGLDRRKRAVKSASGTECSTDTVNVCETYT
jgi:hypothetical protein